MILQDLTIEKALRWFIIVLMVAAVFFAVNYLSAALLPFFVAWFLAYLVYPIVKFFEDRLHIRVRALSIILTWILMLVVVGGIVYLIIPPLIEEFRKLGTLAIGYLHETTNIRSFPDAVAGWVNDNSREIERFFKSKDFTDMMKTTAPQVFKVVNQTWSIVASVVASCIVLLYMFFILLDYEHLTHRWVKIFPKANRPFAQEIMHDVKVALNNYIRGQGLVALIMGVLFCIGFTIIGFPMAIGLGILIGILDLVPYLHTFALIPTAMLAAMKAADTGSNFWVIFGSAVAVFCVVQVIIDFVVTPKVMGKAMGLNPAILLLSLSVWGTLLGFIGLFLALPLTTILMAYWRRYVTRDEGVEESTGDLSASS